MMSTLNYLVTNVIFEYVDFDTLTRPQPISAEDTQNACSRTLHTTYENPDLFGFGRV
jgi:hypothetical protein